MRPRLVHVIPALEWGSAETQVLLITSILADLTEPHICTSSISTARRAGLERRGVTVHVLPHSRIHSSLDFFHLVPTLWRLRPDIIHLWRWEASWGAALVAPFVGTTRLLVDRRTPRSTRSDGEVWGMKFTLNVLKWGTVVPSLSQPGTDFCLTAEPSAHALDADGSESTNLRERFRIPPSDHLIAVVGYLHRRKRIEDVIWAMDLLGIVREGIHLLIVGAGADEGRLRHWVSTTQTEASVHFISNPIRMADFWPQVSSIVFASERDDPPLAMVEAMAHNIPIVASQIGAHETLLGCLDAEDPAATHVPFPVGDRAAIARGIEAILDEPDRSRKRCENARKRVEQMDSLVACKGPHAVLTNPDSFSIAERRLRTVYSRLYGIERGTDL